LDDLITEFYDTPITGAIVADENGKVILNSNRKGIKDIGASIAERDYFSWAREAKPGEVFAGKVVISAVGASKGQSILPLATPVFKDGKFDGVLAVGILLSDLTSFYLNPLNISDDSYVHLFDSNGVWLVSTKYPQLAGVNYFDYIRKNPYPGSDSFALEVKKLIDEPKEGKFLTDSLDRTGQKLLVAVSPIKTNLAGDKGSLYWFLAVVVPASQALLFFSQFEAILNAILLFVLFVVLSFSLFFISSIYSVRKEKDEDNIRGRRV